MHRQAFGIIFIVFIFAVGLVGCFTIQLPDPIELLERKEIFSMMTKDDQYLLMAFEKQATQIPFFDIASFLYNYRLTTKDKTIDGFLTQLKIELTGTREKIGWRKDIVEAYVGKIKQDYKFIKGYEK